MKGRTLGVTSGSVLAFLLIMGAARGATFTDAHERAAGTASQRVASAVSTDAHERAAGSALQGSTIALAADAHDRGASVASAVLATNALQDAHQRGVPTARAAEPSAISSTSSTFAWGTALAGAGAALVLVGLIALVLLVVRRDHRLAMP